MRHLGSRSWRAAVLAVPVLAASLALGPGAAQASVSTPSSGLRWHKLFAINGWHSGESTFSSGDPSWAVKGGVVYLSGSIIRGNSTSNLFGVLPTQARPSHALWMTVYTLDDSVGFISIFPSGKMYARSAPASNSHGYTSLAGLSYPARTMSMRPLHLLNGWQSSQSSFNSGDPSYAVSGGVVYLSGSLHQPSGTSNQVALLPAVARPARVEYLSVYTFQGSSGILQILPNGKVFALDGAAQSYTSLAGISYPAATSARHKLTLLNDWGSDQGTFNSGDPSSSLIGGVVYLSGSLALGVGGTIAEFAVLPKAQRPAHFLYIKTYTWAGTTGTVEVDPDGEVWAYSPTPADAQEYTSLAAISFPLKS